MSEPILYGLAALYLGFALIDLYVAWRLVRAAIIRPHIEVLTAAAVSAVCVTAGALLGAVLGINGVVLAATGERMIEQGMALWMLAVALGIPSLGKVYLLRLLRRWDGDNDRSPRRRATDPPSPPRFGGRNHLG